MLINYVYNEQGVAEYVVIPSSVWFSVQEYLDKNKIQIEVLEKPKNKKFNPREFKGILSPLNLDIEEELLNRRKVWIIHI